MFTRFLVATVVLSSFWAVPTAHARLSRAEHKSLPMMERPYRVGHVYGNSVRRNAKATGDMATEPRTR
jgi:hypothetical protein